IESLPCFHGCISKTECESLFRLKGTEGSYLIRESVTTPGALCLCILHKTVLYTYRILKNDRGYFIFKEIYFKSLMDLIAHYGKPGQGLVTQLCQPLKKNHIESQEIIFFCARVTDRNYISRNLMKLAGK
uniref:SH2 domain-containing protein n=1 Tax=Callorhinchus milii TaxID=7868 RepID=A0A4W3JX27_CALMI